MPERAIHLPNEVLLLIFREFSINDVADFKDMRNMRTLHGLCLTCKYFDRIARPLLYAQYYQTEFDAPRAHIRPFVRTLIARPDLASLIKHIRVRVSYDDQILDNEHRTKPCRWIDWKMARNSDIDALCDQFWPTPYTKTSLENPGATHFWGNTRLQKYSSRAFVAGILIYLSPNIETLRVFADAQSHSVIEGAKCEFPRKLRHFTLDFIKPWNGKDLQCWQGLLKNSHLKSLSAYSLDDFNDPKAFAKFAPSSFSIERLHLTADWLTPQSIAYITRACKGLQSLVIQWDVTMKRWGPTDRDRYSRLYEGMEYRAISEAINPSVKNLRLDWTGTFENDDYKGYDYLDFSSHSLVSLDVPEGAFFRENEDCPGFGHCFPTTLETLSIRNVTEQTVEKLLACNLAVRQINLTGDVWEEDDTCACLLRKYKDLGIICTLDRGEYSSDASNFNSDNDLTS